MTPEQSYSAEFFIVHATLISGHHRVVRVCRSPAVDVVVVGAEGQPDALRKCSGSNHSRLQAG